MDSKTCIQPLWFPPMVKYWPRFCAIRILQRLSPRYDVARLHVDKRDLHTQLLSSERHLTVIEPIESGRLIGHVVLEFDLTPLQARQSELIERNILLAVILIFPAALALWLFIRKTILELNALTDFAQRMVKDQGIEQATSPLPESWPCCTTR